MDRILIRNIHAGTYLEYFFVAAVSAILVIRAFLYITGYPQIGGGGFHIAHMLWGGIIMGAAIILFISYLGEWVIRLGSVIGGIGFGIFIDELGKFITADNNYFFQPTISIIYLIFVTLFFIFRYMEKSQNYSDKEYTMNTIKELEEVIYQDFDKNEQKEVLKLLNKTDQKNIINIKLKEILSEIEAID